MDWEEHVPSSPDSSESSDPETEDYYASSEYSNDSADLFTTSPFSDPTPRNDSATPQWSFYRNASPPLPLPSPIHPAFRADPFSISYQTNTGEPRPEVTHWLPSEPIPRLRSPINLPPRSTQQPPPLSPKHASHGTQQKGKLTNIFHFGVHNTSPFNPSSNQPPPAPTQPHTKSKLTRIRGSLANLNLSTRLRSLAGTKRSREDSTSHTDYDSSGPSPLKAARIAVDDQPPTRVHEANARLQDALARPPRNRAGIARDELRSSIQGFETPRPAPSRPPPRQNEHALETLEGRVRGAVAPVPVPMGLQAPGSSPFQAEEVAFLRRCILLAEGGGLISRSLGVVEMGGLVDGGSGGVGRKGGWL